MARLSSFLRGQVALNVVLLVGRWRRSGRRAPAHPLRCTVVRREYRPSAVVRVPQQLEIGPQRCRGVIGFAHRKNSCILNSWLVYPLKPSCPKANNLRPSLPRVDTLSGDSSAGGSLGSAPSPSSATFSAHARGRMSALVDTPTHAASPWIRSPRTWVSLPLR